MRLITEARRDIPISELLKMTCTLSVQQLIAFQTLIIVHKVINSARPAYLAEKLIVKTENDREK